MHVNGTISLRSKRGGSLPVKVSAIVYYDPGDGNFYPGHHIEDLELEWSGGGVIKDPDKFFDRNDIENHLVNIYKTECFDRLLR
jgi:hypothetical protein